MTCQSEGGVSQRGAVGKTTPIGLPQACFRAHSHAFLHASVALLA